jgi:sec-independent protein translocase protein TatB
MFGVDFSELAIIFLVTLIVVGPKRMPGLVKKIGRWVGKARVMARDFQQQLENEVNLEELNKITDMNSRSAATQTMPPPPAEFTGEPAPESTSTYPYSSPYATDSGTPAAQAAVDDTFSHAHAAGEAPMPHEPAPTEPPAPATADAAAPAAAATPAVVAAPAADAAAPAPAQASFDLSTPDQPPVTTDARHHA